MTGLDQSFSSVQINMVGPGPTTTKEFFPRPGMQLQTNGTYVSQTNASGDLIE
jgi:hypothetical protein